MWSCRHGHLCDITSLCHTQRIYTSWINEEHPDSTTTLAQRQRGRRWHKYVGTASAWFAVGTTTLAQRNFANVGPISEKNGLVNVFLPTICQRCRPCWNKIRSENTCSLIFGRGTCFPDVKSKIIIKLVFNLECTIKHVCKFSNERYFFDFALRCVNAVYLRCANVKNYIGPTWTERSCATCIWGAAVKYLPELEDLSGRSVYERFLAVLMCQQSGRYITQHSMWKHIIVETYHLVLRHTEGHHKFGRF